MASLSVSNVQTTTCSWTISGLSNPFNQTYYRSAGVALSPADGGANPPANIKGSVGAPSSGSSTSVSGGASGLNSGSSFTLYAYAQAANGNYFSAGSATVVTKHNTPSFSSSSSTETSVSVSINPVSTATYYWYDCYRSSDNAHIGTQGGPNMTSATFTGLTANTTYRVQWYASGGGGADSDTASTNITTQMSQLPTPTLNSTSSNGSSVSITLNAVTGATLYHFRLYLGGTYISGTDTSSTSSSFGGLNYGTTYNVRWWASGNGYSDSPQGSTNISTWQKLQTPSVNSVSTTSTSITLVLNSVPNAQYYWAELWRSGSQEAIANSTNGTIQFFNLQSNTTYTLVYYVTASGYVRSDSGTTTATTSPPKLSTPTVQNTSSTAYSVTLTVNSVQNAQTFRFTCNGTTVEVAATSYTFNNLNPNTQYTVTCVAKAPGYTDSDPLSVAITTQMVKLATPVFSATSKTSTTITVTVNTISGAQNYRFSIGSTVINSSNVTATFTGLTQNTSYTVVCVAQATGYIDSDSASITITTKIITNPPTISLESVRYKSALINISTVVGANSYYYEVYTVSDDTIDDSGYVVPVSPVRAQETLSYMGTNYKTHVKVIGDSTHDDSVFSSWLNFTTLPSPNPPHWISQQGYSSWIILDFDVDNRDANYVSYFQLEYRQLGQTSWNIFSSNITSLPVTVAGLSSRTAYEFRTKAFFEDFMDWTQYSTTISVSTGSSRPSNFRWTQPKNSGSTFNLTANEWNLFIDKLNEFRNYLGYSFLSIPIYDPQDIFYANDYNYILDRIREMGPPIHTPPRKARGNTVIASELNTARDSLNSFS